MTGTATTINKVRGSVLRRAHQSGRFVREAGRRKSSNSITEYAPLAAPDHVPPTRVSCLTRIDIGQLTSDIEDVTLPLADRLTAGAILAVVGDPRISITPATCFIPGATAEIGLPEKQVARIVTMWSHAGVEKSWIEKETPQYRASLKDFWIAKYPVTNSEYWVFLRESGYEGRPSTWYLGAYPWGAYF